MKISSVFIYRPVFTTVIAITIVIFGVAGYQFLGVREYPVAERPVRRGNRDAVKVPLGHTRQK